LAPSNVITNSTAETAFDPTYTLPSQSDFTLTPHTTIRLRAWGIVSTGALNLGFTLRMRWNSLSGTIIASSGGITVAGLLSDGGWWMESIVILRSSVLAEAQSTAVFQGGALVATNVPMPSTGTFAIDTNGANDLLISAQWTTATASNSIQMRALAVDVDYPPYS
jgi:hypothetical protein